MEETYPMKPKDLIKSSFSSRVAVVCSADADTVIKRHNLSFTQLVQPFAKLSTEATWQDPSGQSISVKDLSLSFVDLGSWKKRDVDVQRSRRLLSNVVTQSPPPLSTTVNGDCKTVTLNGKSLEYQVRIPHRTTWYETWRKAFLKIQSEVTGNQHEFLNHFVACYLVISSSEVNNTEEIANVIGKLSKIQQQHQYDHPNTWLLPSVLKFYLIVQDNLTNENEAEQVYQNFRTMYGGNFCQMLKIGVEKEPSEDILFPNPWKTLIEQESFLVDTTKMDVVDRNIVADEVENIVQSDLLHPLSPDSEKPPIISQNGDISVGSKILAGQGLDFGTHLSLQDVRRIQLTVNEFVMKALLPYMERQCRNLHESIINRRGMSKSFFSATKRLFGTASKSAPSIVYASESVEVLSRKLSDIYFLFGHYGGAYQLYHQLKKDFYGDAAWLYYSSALELAALSHFMMSQSEPPMAVARAFPVHYINDAIGHYMDQCRMVDAATRCAVLCTECLKQLENNSESAAIFIRMTSEDCDLRSALMLEQAAYCFLDMNSPRKYALHSVLAGYRYAKASLKSHSLNCYRQGYQVYNGKGWRYAEDHVNFTIARLQSVLQISEETTKHLLSTLAVPSPQSTQQIQTFYKEFLSSLAGMKTPFTVPCQLPIPKIKFGDMQIRIAVAGLPVGEFNEAVIDDVESSSTNWDSLEEAVVRTRINNSVKSFKPTRLLFSSSLDNTVHPTVPCNEKFFVELTFYNPLKIKLSLKNVTLNFDHCDLIAVSSLPELELEPEDSKLVRFSVVSQRLGIVTMEAVKYDLEYSGNQVAFQQLVSIRGPRLNNTKAERCGKVYGKDLRNKIVIINDLPLLQASLEGLPNTVFRAENVNFNIILEDKSSVTSSTMKLSRVIIAMDNLKDVLQVLPQPTAYTQNAGNNLVELQCVDNKLVSTIPCVFTAPQGGENALLDILIVYEILDSTNSTFRAHRVIRLSKQIPLIPAVHMEYNCLKMLDGCTYMGLLRLYNLTVDYAVTVNKIFFTPLDVTVAELCSAAEPGIQSGVGDTVIKMNKNESKNVVVKFQDANNVIRNTSEVNVNVQWEISKSNSQNDIAAGNSRLKIVEAIKSIESAFVFNVKHLNRVFADFVNAPLCICDVELQIHSRNPGNYLIQLENNPPKDDIASTNPSSRASGDIFLTGKTTWTLKMEALKRQTVTYTVAVAWPGIYNAAPKVVVTDMDRSVHESYSLHSPLIVAQSLPP